LSRFSPCHPQSCAVSSLFLASHLPDLSRAEDLRKYPELRFLDRFDIAVPTALAIVVFFFGVFLKHVAPGLGTSGWQMLIWAFFLSMIAQYHGT
jgi:stearoyl-CoA desaturase (delta-9 desaturase)